MSQKDYFQSLYYDPENVTKNLLLETHGNN